MGCFFWKGAPALRLVGLGRLEKPREKDSAGDAYFTLTYLTPPLDSPIGIDELRGDRVVHDASFLKAGAAGTVFPLSERQAERLLKLICVRNRALKGLTWESSPKAVGPIRALGQEPP